MTETADGGLGIRDKDWKFAGRLLEKGASASEVETKLLDRGLSPEQVAGLLNEYFVRSIYAEAEYLLAQREPPERVAAKLVKNGLLQVDADRVVADVQKFLKDQEAFFRHALERLASGAAKKEVEGELLSRGAAAEVAKFVLSEASRMIRWEVRKVGLQNIGTGVGLAFFGLVLTLVSRLFAGHVGVWVIMGGLMLTGVVVFFRGLFQIVTGSDVS